MPDTPRPVVAVTTSTFAVHDNAPLRLLEAAGFECRLNPHGRKLTPEETPVLLRDAVGVLAGTEALDREILSQLPRLRAISRCGASMGNVDMQAARELGIQVSNTPFGPTRATAELTVGMLMALLREIPAMDRDIRSGNWKKRTGRLVAGKRVGVVGFGRIGQAVAGILQALGCEIRYHDPYAPGPKPAGFAGMDLPELLEWADVVTLHCSEPEDGLPVLGSGELSRMKQGAWLVNCARGSLVDEEALLLALQSGRLRGAALDTFAVEPYAGALAGLDNVVLTPHVGSYALEGRVQMETDAAQNLVNALAGGGGA